MSSVQGPWGSGGMDAAMAGVLIDADPHAESLPQRQLLDFSATCCRRWYRSPWELCLLTARLAGA